MENLTAHRTLPAMRMGVGMLEVLLSLFVACIILALVLLLGSSVSDERQANQATAEVSLLATVTDQTYRNAAITGAADVTQQVSKNALIPRSWVGSDGSISSPYGSVNVVILSQSAYWVKMTGLSRSACVALTRMAYNPSVIFTQPNQVAQYSLRGNPPYLPNASEISRDCNSSGNYVYVVFYMS